MKRALERLLGNHSPGSKPELWMNPTRVLSYKALSWLSARVDSEWTKRPYIAAMYPEGLLLEVIPSEVIGKPIAQFGSYEFATSWLLREYLSPGDTFLDIGANIGYFSILGANRVGPRGHVIAMEPLPSVRARLERNVSLNGFSNVEIRPEAASVRNGTTWLVLPGETNQGLATLRSAPSGDGCVVTTITVDDLLATTPYRPALMKVDVEGHELEVLEGAGNLLQSDDAPAILFEAFEIHTYESFFARYGYTLSQPVLVDGAVRLTRDVRAKRYRAWEAPNFLATKSRRGLEFLSRLSAF